MYVGPGELALLDRSEPRPDPGQVVVEVAHYGICGTDLLMWSGGLARVRPPVIVGHEFCGVVADNGDCAEVPVGQRVAVEPLLSCETCPTCRSGASHVCERLRILGVDADGAAARYVSVPATRLHPLPDSLSLRDAALTEPASVAVHMVRRSGTRVGDRILVVGGGPIGALVASVCRTAGAAMVVVSEPNETRRALIAGIGIDTFDPVTDDRQRLLDRVDGSGFDVVFELTGVAAGLASTAAFARPQGTILLGGLPHGDLPFPVSAAVTKELTLVGARVYRSDDMANAVRLLAQGAIAADALITREVPLFDAVADAYPRLRDGRNDMKILVTP